MFLAGARESGRQRQMELKDVKNMATRGMTAFISKKSPFSHKHWVYKHVTVLKRPRKAKKHD